MISRKRLERNINLIVAGILATLVGLGFYHSRIAHTLFFMICICGYLILLIVEERKLRSIKQLDVLGYNLDLRELENRYNQLVESLPSTCSVARYKNQELNRQVYICTLGDISLMDKIFFGLPSQGLIVVMETLSEHSALLYFYTFFRGENYVYSTMKSFDGQNQDDWQRINLSLFQASGSTKHTGDMLPVGQDEVDELVHLLSDLNLVEKRDI